MSPVFLERRAAVSQRLKELDILRGIAALTVIFIHVSGFGLSSGNSKISNPVFVINQAGRFSVPLFLIISGYALHYSYTKVKRFSLSAYLRRRFVRILVPYVLWTVIYVFYALREDLKLILSDMTGFLVFLGNQLVFGTAALHLYFIIIIIQLYFLYPLLRKLIFSRPKALLVIAFVLTMLFQTAAYIKLLDRSFLSVFSQQYHLLFPTWLFYFVFGMYLCDNMDSLRNRLPSKAVSFSVWGICLAVVIGNSLLSGTYGSSVKPDIVLYSIASLIMLYSIVDDVRKSKSLPGRFLIWFSRQSYAAYLSHILFFKLILLGLGSVYKGFFSHNLIGVLLIWMAAVSITSVFMYAASRTPLAVFFGCIRNGKVK